MSATPWIRTDISKEIRALLPLWIGCVGGVWVGGFADEYGLFVRVGFLVFVLGAPALGALSVGHEYTNRTLPMLLSMPASRRRTFAVKATVLAVMLVTLGAVARARLPIVSAGREMQDTGVVKVMALLGATFLAPWLTMACRNPIAGALFSLSLPAALLVGSELLSLAMLGQVGTPEAGRLRMEIFWCGMLALSAFGAFSSWRAFDRLQAIEGPPGELRLPRWRQRSKTDRIAPVSRSRHPAWHLLAKELHLQQLTFMVSGLYLCGWGAALLVHRRAGADVAPIFIVLTVVHGIGVALLAGSLASAEERQLGTLDWQLLLPMAAARQWLIKCGVVFGVAVVLALGLPAMLGVLGPSIEPMRINWAFAATVLVVAAVSLYVSSLCPSGLKALLIAAPAAFAVLPVLALSEVPAFALTRLAHVATDRVSLIAGYDDRVLALEAAVLSALLLRFASINHRSIDSDVRRVWRQVGLIVGLMTLSAIAFTAAQMLVFRR